MKNIVRLILIITTSTLFAQTYPPQESILNVDYNNYQIPTSAPDYLQFFTQPEFNNIKTIRITDPANQYFDDNNSLRHAYSTEAIWNSDDSVIRLGVGNNTRFLDGNTYEVLPFNYPTTRGLHWSKIHNNIQYGWWYNNGKCTIVKATFDFNSYTDVETYMRDFIDDGYTDMRLEGNHNEPSNTDITAYHGRRAENDNVWVVVYDLENNTILHEYELPWVQHANDYDGAGGLRYVKVSPNSDYLVLGYFSHGTGENQGVWRHELNNFNNKIQLTTGRGHSDVGINQAGEQVWIHFYNYNDYEYSLVESRLSDGAETNYYLPYAIRPWWGHISMRNINRPGWAYVTLGGIQANVVDGDAGHIVLAIKLDGSGIVENFGRTYNTAIDYNHETQASVNSDGTKIIFASGWGGYLDYLSHGTAFVSEVNTTLSTSNNEINDIVLWPNPATDKVFLSKEYDSIEVSDLMGRIVGHTNNLSYLSSGIYIIKIKINTNWQSFKVFKR